MATPIAVSDRWSPSLDALLEWLWLDERGLALPNPDLTNIIQADLPLFKGEIKGEWYWCVSSPYYLQQSEQITRYRKRWDYQDKHLDWGKKKAKVNTSEGVTKSYDLPLKLVETPRIDWFAVGDKEEIERLLFLCDFIGKKRSQGKGQVCRWEVREIEGDYSLWDVYGNLARPMPLSLIGAVAGTPPFNGGACYDFVNNCGIMNWGWRTPYWLPANQNLCLMPLYNIKVA